MMKHVTGISIRSTYNELKEAIEKMDEKFVKEDDPSLSVMNFMDRISQAMGVVKTSYLEQSKDRNRIIPIVLKQVKEIEAACGELTSALSNIASGTEPPEDTNQNTGDWD